MSYVDFVNLAQSIALGSTFALLWIHNRRLNALEDRCGELRRDLMNRDVRIDVLWAEAGGKTR